MIRNSKSKLNYNKLPPQNLLAEEVLLGHLLTNDIIAHHIITIINSDFFSLEKHKLLYLYIINIYNKYQNINTTHLVYLLWEKKVLGKIGGLNQIIKFIQKAQVLLYNSENNSYIKQYITILYEHYIRRIFIQYSYNILQLSYIYSIPTNKLYHKSTQYLQEINKLVQLQSHHQLDDLISDFLSKFQNEVQDNLEKTIFSGFKSLDTITNGFHDGDLIVVAGRPSMGKTSFAINITHHIILKLNLGVYIFSLEMSKKQILDKILSIASEIPLSHIGNQKITTKEWRNLYTTCQALIDTNLQIDDNGYTSIRYIKSKAQLIHSIKKKQQLLSITFN